MTTLAYLSGHYKEALSNRSLLTGQENCITMEIKFDKSFMAMSFVWSVIRKHIPQEMVDNIRGMRMFKDQTGAVFDVAEHDIQKFEDIFVHLKDQQRINFEINRCKALPELREDDQAPMGGRGGYGGGGYGNQGYGNQGGYNNSYNRGGSNN